MAKAARASGGPPVKKKDSTGFAFRFPKVQDEPITRDEGYSPRLQARLIASHARALTRLLPDLATCLPEHVLSDMSQTPADDPARAPLRIAVIGGGLFPRTALALARV